VIARTTAVIEPGGVLGRLTCEPPLTLRQVRSDEPGCCQIRLVGTAAGPLAGDDLALSLQLRAGARASLQATGASIAQGRGGSRPAALLMRAELADGAALHAEPGALIVCGGSRVDVSVDVALGTDAVLDWRELIVLGRSGERSGNATLRWNVTRLGRPVLRQFVDLSDPALTGWAGMTAHRRVLGCALIAGPALASRTIVESATAVAQFIDNQTVLATVLSTDAATAKRDLSELCDQIYQIG